MGGASLVALNITPRRLLHRDVRHSFIGFIRLLHRPGTPSKSTIAPAYKELLSAYRPMPADIGLLSRKFGNCKSHTGDAISEVGSMEVDVIGLAKIKLSRSSVVFLLGSSNVVDHPSTIGTMASRIPSGRRIR